MPNLCGPGRGDELGHFALLRVNIPYMREGRDTAVARVLSSVRKVLVRGLLEGGQEVRIAFSNDVAVIVRVIVVAGSRGGRGVTRILHPGAFAAGAL